MADGTLYIGTRTFSSWSLRGWLAVHLAGLDVEEVVVPLHAGATPKLATLTPHAMVPYLEHRAARVWESLAICEYCAEHQPALWPAEPTARAAARSIAAQMHAGFAALRQAMPMDLTQDHPGRGHTQEALADIAKIEAIWAHAREMFGGGPYLFGPAFTAADAMYAPVVTRLLTYAPPINAATRDYCEAVRSHPLVAAWYEAAAQEPAAWRALHEPSP